MDRAAEIGFEFGDWIHAWPLTFYDPDEFSMYAGEACERDFSAWCVKEVELDPDQNNVDCDHESILDFCAALGEFIYDS